MKKLVLVASILACCLALPPAAPLHADDYPPGYDQPAGSYRLSPEELDDLLAPIALYPDPLIAQILPAATFVEQIDEAARYLRQYGRYAQIDAQQWDVSVRAVAHYPDVLFMMDQKYEWTVSLGQAFLDQEQDVMDAIQRLRADALAEGNLYSTGQQQVIDEPDGIRIVPASADYIYVPVYDPQVVYLQPYDPGYPVISFGTGLVIGAWLSRDCDWHGHRVYYHGWRGSGWIARSKPHIHDRGRVYTGQSAATIRLNRQVLQHDTRHFRQELHQETVRRSELGGAVKHPGAGHQRPSTPVQQRKPETARPQAAGRPHAPDTVGQRPETTRQRQPEAGRTAGAVRQPAAAAPAAPAAGNRQAPAPSAATSDVFRGRDVQRSQPASHTGYGGYGSSSEASRYRARGQASQESMRQVRPAASTPPRSAAPAGSAAPPRPAAVAPRPAPASAPAPKATPSRPLPEQKR